MAELPQSPSLRKSRRVGSKVVPILFDSYLAVIKNSPGSSTFRNFFALVDNQRQDILRNGELSCAFFVSSILVIFGLIKSNHCTVDSTVKDLERFGWHRTRKLRPGSILVWEPITYEDGETHSHIGFYLGEGNAISNTFSTKTPSVHHYTFGVEDRKPIRKVKAIYWNRKLMPKPKR